MSEFYLAIPPPTMLTQLSSQLNELKAQVNHLLVRQQEPLPKATISYEAPQRTLCHSGRGQSRLGEKANEEIGTWLSFHSGTHS